MGLSSSLFNDNRFYCYNRSESFENLQTSNQFLLKMQRLTGSVRADNSDLSKVRKGQERLTKDREASIASEPIFCINQVPNKGILRFQNLKKKVSKLKRKINSSSVDYSKLFYDFLSSWSHKELQSLKHEYDALGIMRVLDKQTNDSRPQVSSLMFDLDVLFKSGLLSDTEISFKGENFKVHRALLSVRSVFFRQCFHSWKAQPDIMLSSYSTNSSASCGSCHQQNKHFKKPIPIYIENPSVTPDVFRSILQYIYTEQLDIDEDQIDNWDMIYLLREKFHLPNRLQFDMKRLFEDTSDTDCILVFSQSSDFLSLDFSPFSTKTISKDAQLLNFIRHFHFNIANNSYDQNCDETGIEYDNNFLYNVSYELPCHRAVLAARSNFFKRIIEIKLRDQQNDDKESQNPHRVYSKTSFEAIINAPMRITIEENIISHRYARVILNCLYTGQLNMQLIVTKHYADRRSPTLDLTASLKVQSTTPLHRLQLSTSSERPSAAGLYIHTFLPSCINCVRDLMQLYQIGSYIEFKLLCHNCEDLLIRNISLENFIEVLHWSSEAFGSVFVRRHVVSWMRDEFMQIVGSQFLQELSKSELIEIVSSVFTQAPEAEILNGVLKWAESQIELLSVPKECPRDSNIVIMLRDLYSKRSHGKNKHANDPALAKLISDLVAFINLDHFFPGTEAVKSSLIRRGVIDGVASVSDLSDPYIVQQAKRSWCRLINCRDSGTDLFVSPRLGPKYNILSLDLPQPQFDCNKHCQSFKGPRFVTLLHDQLKVVIAERSRNTKLSKCYDDSAHHDIDSMRPPGRVQPLLFPPSQSQLPLLSMPYICSSDPPDSLGKLSKQHNFLNSRITGAIHERVKDLQSGVIVQRALLMPCVSWPVVFHLLRLQSLREYGIADHLVTEIFSEKVTCDKSTRNTGRNVASGTPISSSRSNSRLNSNKSDNFSAQSLRKSRKTNSRKFKESVDSNRCFSYYQSNVAISASYTQEIENDCERNCRCRENKSAFNHNKHYDINVHTNSTEPASNLHKDNNVGRNRNSYPTSPSLLLLPSTLEVQNTIRHNNNRHRAKHKIIEKYHDSEFLSERDSFRIYKDDTVRSLNVGNNKSIRYDDDDDGDDDVNRSYNPWVFNGFNFKTTSSDVLDSDLKLQHGSHHDSGRLFFGESPKTHSPLYGVRKQQHQSVCLACNNISQSSFYLNDLRGAHFDLRNCLDDFSKEVEL